MKIQSWICLTILMAMCSSISPGSLAAESGSLGQFDGNTDIGSPAKTGSASYNAATHEYELSGSGANMWAAKDEFQFLWQRMKGDFILRTRFEFVGKGAEPH